ncbi:protein of unknown function DUF450 [Beggiatoa sp. PS]|nr:protein of unknown function DUF450 [Beggiatoa sp. PS]
MDLIDELKTLSSKVAKQINLIQTEEATKNAFVMPFISALGYNVFDPTEVTPELTADIGTKKGEKVDYAILKDGKPIILFECKWCGVDLDKEHKSQLYRYFSVTEARFAILTNGVIYRFYTDLEEPNKMDSRPFFEFNVLDIKESAIEDLKRFKKSSFDLDETLTAATELKYTREIKRLLAQEIANPSENFVKFFASQVYSGKLTQIVKQQFTDLTKKALNQYINDRIHERLKSALAEEDEVNQPSKDDESSEEQKKDVKSKIITTEEEIEGYHIIKALLRELVSANKIALRDTVNYCGILFDDNNRKPICRLYFNNPKKNKLAFLMKKKRRKSFLLKNSMIFTNMRID